MTKVWLLSFFFLIISPTAWSGEKDKLFFEHGVPRGVAFSRNARYLAVINDDNELVVAEASTGKPVRPILSLWEKFEHSFRRDNKFFKGNLGWEYWQLNETLTVSDDGDRVSYLYFHPSQVDTPAKFYRPSDVPTTGFVINTVTGEGREFLP